MNNVWGPIGRTVFQRTYSRRKPDGTREEWPETVWRVVHGNCELVPEEFIEPGERERLIDLIGSFALLPAGRHLWVTGVPGRRYTNNCHHAGWGPRLRDHVGFLANCLMSGGGSGSPYTNSAIGVLQSPAGTVEPRFLAPTHEDRAELAHRLSSPSSTGAVYRVPDTKEGWAEALCRLTDLAEDGGGTITFDVTDVRPRGSLIRGFGGTASGPAPLVEMLANVADVLNRCVGRPYTSLDLMEVDHAIAACVIAGNVRRSARMSVKSWADEDILDFIRCKADSAEHWSTNISVTIDDAFFKALDHKDPQAQTVLEEVVTFADAEDPRQIEVVERNRRIGVGILGFQEWAAAHGYRYSQVADGEIMGAKLSILRDKAQRAAAEYAFRLGIPTPIKTTCVAPTGTVSTLPGVTPGIHPIFGRYFIRRVRFAADDPLLVEHQAQGHHIEDDLCAGNTKVVAIPCADSILGRYDENLIEQADEISPADMLATQAFVQRHWADNGISFTLNVGDGVTTGHLAEVLQHFLPQLKGVTVFPHLSRPQSPFERISKTAYEIAAGAEVGQAIDDCVNGACPVR